MCSLESQKKALVADFNDLEGKFSRSLTIIRRLHFEKSELEAKSSELEDRNTALLDKNSELEVRIAALEEEREVANGMGD